MAEQSIISKMNQYIQQSADWLVLWLEEKLSKVCDDWWNECVIDRLSDSQRKNVIEKGGKKLSELDLPVILRFADNNWVHCSGILPGKDVIIHDIEAMIKFWGLMETSQTNIASLETFKENVGNGNIADISHPENADNSVNIEKSTCHAEIKEKDTVYLTGDPKTKGMVFSIQNVGNTVKYEVFVNGEIKPFYAGQIALVEEKISYDWIDIDTFQSRLSAYEINNPSAENLYSLHSAKIDFVPYQFRPALKMIKADEPHILIADSVGVGKTIEAGLIIKELEARSELDNVVVICPKPLVSERKWEQEMKKFDEDFTPLTGDILRQIISDTNRDAEWPARFNKIIIPYSILDGRTYEGSKKTFVGLKDLDPAPHFGLVIVDEAHHIRNGSLEKEKAYAYKCTKYSDLCGWKPDYEFQFSKFHHLSLYYR